MSDCQSILALLPQTQCTRCGYPDCESYATAIHEGSAPINQCPPGGEAGIQRLAKLSGQPALRTSVVLPLAGMLGLQHKLMTPVNDIQPVNNDCKKQRQ